MKTALKWGTVLALAGLTMVTCKVVSNDNGSASTFFSAKFEKGEMSGWEYDETTMPGGFVKFTASNMFELANGAVDLYTTKGMSQGYRQDMKKAPEGTYQSWIMDFGTEANAVDMYNVMFQLHPTENEVAGSYPTTKAYLYPLETGYKGYAVFGKYMVDIGLDGCGVSEAKNITVQFLQTIEQKLKDLGLLSKS